DGASGPCRPSARRLDACPRRPLTLPRGQSKAPWAGPFLPRWSPNCGNARRPMDKRTAILFAALAVAFVVVAVVQRPEEPGGTGASVPAEAARDAGPSDAGASARADAGDAGEQAAPAPSGEEGPAGETSFPTTDAGATLLNGTVPPGLAADAPKSV